MRAIDQLATHVLEKALHDLREGRISCVAFSMNDAERFGFAVDFAAGDDLADGETPRVQSDGDEPPALYRPPQSGDRCPSCSSLEIREAGDQKWVCLVCNTNWTPFGANEGRG